MALDNQLSGVRAADMAPPQAIDAEMAVLGAVLLDEEALENALNILKPEHFYKTAHQKIFAAASLIALRGQPVDVITVTEELKKNKFLAEIGGERYLSDLLSKISTTAHLEHYAKIVYNTALARELIRISTNTVQSAFKQEQEVDELIDRAQEHLFSLSQKQDIKGFAEPKDLADEILKEIERLQLDGTPIKGVPTGIREFDVKTGGFRKSELIILAARPSVGKTALALNIAYHAAVAKKVPVGIFSLEMNRQDIYMRMICTAAQASLYKVRNGYYPKRDFRKLSDKVLELSKAPIYIDDTPSLTATDIRVRARRLASDLKKKGQELGMVIIDYIGLIRGAGKKFESRQQEVAEISRMLKELARNLKIPVVALSQLNRQTTGTERAKSTGNRPQLSDLRDSGAIEQDADIVALLHREIYYKNKGDALPDESLKEKAELNIAKQRNGPTGTIELRWLEEFTLFTEPIKEEYGESFPAPASAQSAEGDIIPF